MSKLSELKKLGPEDLPDAPDWFIEQFLPFQNAFNEDVFGRLNGDVGLANLTDALKDVKLTHGVEKIIKNPLYASKRLRPQGVIAVKTDGLPLAAQPVWRNIGADQIGVTVYYGPPPGFVSLLRNASQSIPSTNGSVQWDADVFSRTASGTTITDGSLSYDITTTSGTPAVNSKINCLAAGIVLVCGQIILSASAGGTDRSVWIQKNNSTSPRWGSSRGGFDAGNSTGLSCSAQIDVVAGDYLQLQAYQNTGAGLNLVSSATISRPNQIQVRYIAPPIDYEANVTLRIMGG